MAATLRSLEGFADHQVHLILGGRKKDKDVSALTEIVRRKAKYLYLVGESADFFAQALNGVVPFEVAGTVRRAVALAAERARADEVVLLSPACASFDQFENFSARGYHFQQLVRELPEGVDG